MHTPGPAPAPILHAMPADLCACVRRPLFAPVLLRFRFVFLLSGLYLVTLSAHSRVDDIRRAKTRVCPGRVASAEDAAAPRGKVRFRPGFAGPVPVHSNPGAIPLVRRPSAVWFTVLIDFGDAYLSHPGSGLAPVGRPCPTGSRCGGLPLDAGTKPPPGDFYAVFPVLPDLLFSDIKPSSNQPCPRSWRAAGRNLALRLAGL